VKVVDLDCGTVVHRRIVAGERMPERQWLVALVIALAAGAIAYVLGRRQRDEDEAEGEGEQAADAEAKPRARPAAKTEPVKAEKEPEKKEPEDKASPVAKLDYEEDADVDPTRVGTSPASKPTEPRKIYQPPLKRIAYDEDADVDEPTQVSSWFLLHATAQTDTGRRRKKNEDSLLVLDTENLFVIADGMGGYKGGALASQLAVTTIGDAFRARAFEGPAHEGVPRDATNLARAIQMANAAILEHAKKQPDLEGMGTTICAAKFSPNKRRLFIGHVGDSRCYRLRDGVFKQVTADHTMADHGVTGPESTQLSRAVGIWPTVPIDIVAAVPQSGDTYLLCSDGLTKMLTDESIGSLLAAEEDPKAAVERLVFFANERGGKDNITIILVRVVTPTAADKA
jgi:protein phosphatase